MKLSLCMICKNEEKKIARCINSVKEKVDEIVVVDTGSTDQTIDIAKKLGGKVFEMPWENDFSKAKNYAISKSQGDWIIFLDADEYLMASHIGYLRSYILEAENRKKDSIFIEIVNLEEEKVQGIFKTIRIFKHHTDISFKGRIHESLSKKGGKLEAITFTEPLRVLHDGYSKEAMEEKNKVDRNLEMLLREYEVDPMSSDLCYYLMDTYYAKKDLEQTWLFGQRVLEYDNGSLFGIKQTTYRRLLEICHKMQRKCGEMRKLYEDAVAYDADYPDFDYEYAFYFCEHKEYEKTIKYLNSCLSKMDKYKGIAESNVMGNVIVVLKLLVRCYIEEGRLQETVPLLVKILRVNPYEYTSLYNLLSIVGGLETGEALGEFLKKLYDFNNVKDQMVLIQMSQKLGNQGLYDYIVRGLSKMDKERLGIK